MGTLFEGMDWFFPFSRERKGKSQNAGPVSGNGILIQRSSLASFRMVGQGIMLSIRAN